MGDRHLKFEDEDLKSDRLVRLSLSDPEGFLFSNTILAALFEEFEEG